MRDFTNALKQHEALIYKVCNLYTSDKEERKDIFQEIVLQAWTAYPRFRHEAAITTWLYRIALNTAITYKRRERKHSSADIDFDIEDANTCAFTEEYKILHRLVADLAPLEKALIMLYLEDYSHQQIAEIMGISISNVGTRLGRIKERLKKQAQSFITG